MSSTLLKIPVVSILTVAESTLTSPAGLIKFLYSKALAMLLIDRPSWESFAIDTSMNIFSFWSPPIATLDTPLTNDSSRRKNLASSLSSL